MRLTHKGNRTPLVREQTRQQGTKRRVHQGEKGRNKKFNVNTMRTHTSARAACTAALLTLTATTGLRAATALSKGTRLAFSYGKTRNSGVLVVDAIEGK